MYGLPDTKSVLELDPSLWGTFMLIRDSLSFVAFPKWRLCMLGRVNHFAPPFVQIFLFEQLPKWILMVLMVCGYHLSVFFCGLLSEIGFYLFISCRCKKLFVVAILLIAAIVLEYSSFCITSNMIHMCVFQL